MLGKTRGWISELGEKKLSVMILYLSATGKGVGGIQNLVKSRTLSGTLDSTAFFRREFSTSFLSYYNPPGWPGVLGHDISI